MNKTVKIVAGIAVVALVVWGGIVANKNKKEAINEVVKVGVVLPLSGEAASYGQAAQYGVEIAMEKINKEGRVKVQAVYEDSQMDSKKAASAIQKLVTVDGVKYVIGFSSGETLAMCPIAEANKVILITSASSPEVTKCGDYTFRTMPADTYQAKEMADKLVGKGFSRVAVIYVNNDYGKGLAEEFKKDFKGEIVAFEAHGLKETNFRTMLVKVKSANPDAIFLISQLPEVANLLTQTATLGINQPIFGSEATKDDNVIKSVSETALKNFSAIFMAQYTGSMAQEYRASYMAKYNVEPGAFADFIHDNMLVIGDALVGCKADDVRCVKANIYNTNMAGATGKISFDQNGDIKEKPYQLYKVEGGKFVEAQ